MSTNAIRINRRERTSILNSLGAGVVPRLGLHHIQVGRKREVEAFISDLTAMEDGGAAIRFVVGRYGSGKSFLLNLVQTLAMERRHVVVRADITTQRRLHGSRGEARSLYAELMRNLSTRSKPEGGALASLIERWVSEIAQEVEAGGGTQEDIEARLVEACKPLQDYVSGYDFAAVLARYYQGFRNHDEAQQAAAIRWLRGEYATRTEARDDLGVRTIIDDAGIHDYLKLFAKFVHVAGYSGLLVCLDELVVLSHRLNHKVARNNNYEAILRILNDCLQGSAEHLGFIFAATEDCLEDKRRGLFSYEALATRLAPNRFAVEGLIDLSNPVMQLESLRPEDMAILLHNIRHVHAEGNPEKYVLPDDAIERYLMDCHSRMGAQYFLTPREMIKDFVGLLNVLEHNPDADWQALLGRITTTRVQTVEPALTDPSLEGEVEGEGDDAQGDIPVNGPAAATATAAAAPQTPEPPFAVDPPSAGAAPAAPAPRRSAGARPAGRGAAPAAGGRGDARPSDQDDDLSSFRI